LEWFREVPQFGDGCAQSVIPYREVMQDTFLDIKDTAESINMLFWTGLRPPVSQRETQCRRICSISANCPCVQPLAVRRAFILIPVITTCETPLINKKKKIGLLNVP
jgi:hypothetical protein